MLAIVSRFRVNREPVAVQVARRRSVCRQVSAVCDTLETAVPPQGSCTASAWDRIRCGTSQSYLRHPPPGWAMRDGTAIRSQLQLPVVLVCTTGEARDARPPSTVDRLSSVVPDGKQGTILREARQCPHLFVCTEHEGANTPLLSFARPDGRSFLSAVRPVCRK